MLCTIPIYIFVIHIQSIGSGLSISSDLFNNFLFTKSWVGLEEISLLLLSLVPVKPGDDKPKRLTKSEREVFSLGQEQKDTLIGLLLGDLNIRKFCIRRRRDAKLLFFYGPTVLKKNRGVIKQEILFFDLDKALIIFTTCMNYAGIYDSAHLIFHGPSVRRKIGV